MENFLGSLLAGAVGDALGAPIEFNRIGDIRARYGPSGLTDYAPAFDGLGSITDDTQMTLFTLEGLILARRNGIDPMLTVRAAYGRWLQTQQGPETTHDGWLIDVPELHSLRAPGNTCLTALRKDANNNSKGCGGVMRVAPCALWSDDPAEVFALAAGCARLTHGHPSGYLSAGVLAVIVHQVLRGADVVTATGLARQILVGHQGHEEQTALLDKVAGLGRPTPELIESELGGGWVGEEALAISLLCAIHADNLADGLLLAVNHSGDSDSTGAICGNILGARDGAGAIPSHWLEPLELREVIERLGKEGLEALSG
ncbi:ADP-ribosylglycohydrolase family protein [Lentzea tibetensis]|uniref:ADP-ribosylglycohydrolase family protein n=1 Tax=Lentzea tibetensis TaxID=2591470 RepID=UPI001F2AB51F|nr:ADP-ribosylglycohydrolase family protein [Lentzea tibetensis]